MRPILRDPSLQRELLDRGYVTVPLIDAEAVASFRREVAAMRPDDGFAPTGEGPFNLSTYHCTFLDTSTSYKRQANEAIRRVFEPRIAEHVIDYRVLTSNLYVKPPGRGRFQIHQNWPTLQDLSVTTLTAWCPLQDCTAENATLHVVPGSHKLTPDVATPSEPPFFASFEEALTAEHLVPVDVPAGHALLFDDSLLHWSPENRSDEARWAVQIETVPVEEQPVLYHLDRGGPEPRWELFEVDFDFFVERSIAEVVGRPTGLRSLGHRPHRNRPLTEPRFVELLRAGPAIRRAVYETGAWPEAVPAGP